MKSMSDIDSNFKVTAQIEKDGMLFYSIDALPFHVNGVYKEKGKYRRFPEAVAAAVSEGVHRLHANTAGGRVRFKTNSKTIAILAKMENIGKMPHFALTGSAGFDLYADGIYANTFVPPFGITDGYESRLELVTQAMREITIYFPLYSDVIDLHIGLEQDAILAEPEPYAIQKPFVSYGSSITQGGCVSRPGNAYQSILSRRFGCDFLNLGFAGSAKAEDEMTDYIKRLNMSLFVYDYDHNAPSVEHLANTHERMFQAIRGENPNLPILILSRPKYVLDEEEQQRLRIIQNTYNHAVEKGDKHVYLLDGPALMAYAENDGTVDNCHPNDLGFASMARVMGDLIERIL